MRCRRPTVTRRAIVRAPRPSASSCALEITPPWAPATSAIARSRGRGCNTGRSVTFFASTSRSWRPVRHGSTRRSCRKCGRTVQSLFDRRSERSRRAWPYRPTDGRTAAPDRGVRRWRVLDGGGQPAPRRLRAATDRGRAPEGLLRADRLRRRRPLRGALLPRVLARALRAEPPVAVPPRPCGGGRGHGRAPAQPGPDLRRRRQRRVAAGRLARARDRPDPRRGPPPRDRALRAERRLAVLVRRIGQRVPRSPRAGARAR